MIRKITLVLTVSAIILAAMPDITLSQNLTLLKQNGYSLSSNNDSTYNFFAKCVGNDEEYYLGFMAVTTQEKSVYTFCSVVYNTDLGLYKLTDEDINEIVKLLNEYLPEGLWYSYMPVYKKLALHYMVYEDLFHYINDERAQQYIVNVFDVLLKCACTFDILTPELMKQYSKSGAFGIAGGNDQGKAEVLKKLKSASEKFKIKIPEIMLGK